MLKGLGLVLGTCGLVLEGSGLGLDYITGKICATTC